MALLDEIIDPAIYFPDDVFLAGEPVVLSVVVRQHLDEVEGAFTFIDQPLGFIPKKTVDALDNRLTVVTSPVLLF